LTCLKVGFALGLSFVLLAIFVVPVFAVEYKPAVKVGQYVKLKYELTGNDALAASGNDVDWKQFTVVSITGNEIVINEKNHHNNGALDSEGITHKYDIETGLDENWVESYERCVLAGNLQDDDPIRVGSSDRVDRTEVRTYLGVSRQVNIVFLNGNTYDEITNDIISRVTFTEVFDKASGMLLERERGQTWIGGAGEGTYNSQSFVFNGTNIFNIPNEGNSSGGSSANNAGFPIQYIIIVIAVVAMAAVLAVFLVKKRKTALPASEIKSEQTAPAAQTEVKPSTPPAPKPVAFCKECGVVLKSDAMFCKNCGAPREDKQS